MSEWKKVKLGEITESCLGKMLDAAKNRGEYKPYLANLNVRWGSFDTDCLSLMRFEEDEDERYGIKYGDLIICEGGEPGRCAIWKEQLPDMKIQKALHRVRPKDGLVDIFYLFYWFLLAGKRNWIDQYCTGATIKHLPGQKLKEVVIDLPPINVQLRIATILSRYDSLIENYQKQIKLLEEAAQRLYKEWFVDLRFPGHETTTIADGVPEGWEKKKVGEIGKVITGKTPSTAKKEYYGGQIPFITIPDMHTGIYPTSSQFLSDLGANSQSGKFIPANSLMVSCIGTAGLVCITKEECQTNQQINSLVLNDNSLLYYMYNTFLSLKEHLYNIGSNGATMTNVNKSKFESIEILIPNNSISNLYNKAVEQSYRGIKTLSSQIRLLTEARDRLLPKLMSGEISVDTAQSVTNELEVRKELTGSPKASDL